MGYIREIGLMSVVFLSGAMWSAPCRAAVPRVEVPAARIEELSEVLDSTNQWKALDAMRELENIGAPASALTGKVLGNRAVKSSREYVVDNCLRAISGPALDVLVAGLEDEYVVARHRAIRALKKRYPPPVEALPALLARVDREEGDVLCSLGLALAPLERSVRHAAAMSACFDSRDLSNRNDALDVLSKYGAPPETFNVFKPRIVSFYENELYIGEIAGNILERHADESLRQYLNERKALQKKKRAFAALAFRVILACMLVFCAWLFYRSGLAGRMLLSPLVVFLVGLNLFAGEVIRTTVSRVDNVPMFFLSAVVGLFFGWPILLGAAAAIWGILIAIRLLKKSKPDQGNGGRS